MDLKDGPVSMYVRPIREVKQAYICIGFKAAGNQALLCGLKGDLAHETAVLYALFLNCRAKVYKNLAEETKSKVGDIKCAIQDGEFNIYVECDSSQTCIRKCLKAVFAGLNPAKVKSDYKSFVRQLDVTPSDDAFESIANSLITSLKNITVVVSGKAFGSANSKKDELQELLSRSVEKLKPDMPGGRGGAKSAEGNPGAASLEITFVHSKTGSPEAVVAAWMVLSDDFPRSFVLDRQLYVYESQKTAFGKLEDKKETFEKHLAHLDKLDDPAGNLAVVAIRNHLLSASNVLKLADSKFTSKGLAGEIVKLF